MSDIFQTLTQCFDGFRDPTGQHLADAEKTLNQFYSDPAFIQVLIQYVSTEGIDEVYKKHGVVHFGILFGKYFLKFPAELQEQIFNSYLPLLILPDSKYVRRYIRKYVQIGLKENYTQTVANFIVQQQQNLNDIGIEASLYLLTMLVNHQEDNVNSLTPISIPLIEAGLNSGSDDTKLAAVLHGILIANLIPTEEGSQLLTRYVECGTQLLINLTTSNNQEYDTNLDDLIKGLTYLLDQEPEGINTNQILEVCFKLLSNQAIVPNFRSRIQSLSDILIMDSIDKIMEDPNQIQMILHVYFQYAQSIFDPNELSYDMSEHTVFSSISTEFSSYPEALEIMWNIIIPMTQSLEGRFASICALLYSLTEGCDFYQSKIIDLKQLFIQGLNDPAECTNEAAAKAIGELAISQKKQIKSISGDLIQTLLAKLSQSPNAEYVNSIDNIVKAADDIGNAFSYIFETLFNLLQVADSSLQFSIFNCLYSLVQHSPKQARHFFQQIVNLCIQVLSSNNQLDLLKGRAISILSFLMESSTKLFAPLVPQFHQLIIQNLQSNDQAILYESIRAYGHLLRNYSEQQELKESIQTVFPKLIDFASKEIKIRGENEDEVFLGEETEGVDYDSIIEPIIRVVGSSILVASYALSAYPNLIQSNMQRLFDAIQNQFNVGDPDIAFNCAQGCANLFEAIQKIGFNEQTQPIVSNIVSLLSQIAASESGTDAAGAAFTAISDVIASDEVLGILSCYNYLGSILGSVQAVFKGEMLYQQDKNKYIEELHTPAMRVVREIIAAMKNDCIKVVSNLIPIFNGHISDKSTDMRDLVLQFFGDLVYWASEATDDEIKRNTFILAKDAIEKRKSAIGFGCIKQLAIKSPNIIQGNLEELLVLIKNQLVINEETPTELLQSIQDNAESALAMIAMNILKENFPINDFLQIALNKMPAQLEVEENNDHISFFFWLFQRAGALSIQEQNLPFFAAVPIRLFSDPIDQLEDYCVSPENVTNMQNILKQFAHSIPNFENFVKETCGNDDFKIESVVDALSS